GECRHRRGGPAQGEGQGGAGLARVYIQDVDRDLASSLGLDTPAGALIAQVIPASPADKSGIKPGDVIVRFNGKPIKDSGDLPHQVGLLAPGETGRAELIREGKR